MTKNIIITAVTPAASPSKPSVRFKLFVHASMINTAQGIYIQLGSSIYSFKIGIYVSVPKFILFKYKTNAVATIINPSNFKLGFNPFGFFKISFIKSSINPISPYPKCNQSYWQYIFIFKRYSY